MPEIEIYTTEWCGYCRRAKALLDELDMDYEEIPLDGDPRFRHKLFELTGNWTVPQIVVDGQPIGGFVELWQLHHDGSLATAA